MDILPAGEKHQLFVEQKHKFMTWFVDQHKYSNKLFRKHMGIK